jgi:hypothetical protein
MYLTLNIENYNLIYSLVFMVILSNRLELYIPETNIFVLFLAEGISNNLANYMTMALDPNVDNLVKYMTREIPAYSKLLEQLQLELEIKLLQSKLTVLELFHKVAIRFVNVK